MHLEVPRKLDGFLHFRARGIAKCVEEYRGQSGAKSDRKGRKLAIKVFRYAALKVPAYRQFLSENASNVNWESVDSIADFKRLPLLSKDNYLRAYDYADLFPDRQVTAATTISATSGSTGEPFFFPRNEHHDHLYEHSAETFLTTQFDLGSQKTLGVIGFALGIWIGGIFTYKTFNKIAQKGYNLTLLPIGVNKDLYLKSIRKFAGYYDQLLLMGYPPFIKEVLDSGSDYGLDWQNYRVRILTAAEGYSEAFRNYIAKKAAVFSPLNDIINIYGTVEQGTLAHETSLANLIRRMASEDRTIFKTLFPKATNLPTLAQYYPENVYIEEVEGQIVVTSYSSAIPLVRYRYSDLGGVLSFDEMLEKLKSLGIDIFAEGVREGVTALFQLPFVYVYARADMSIVFRGANIFPGEIRAALDYPDLSDRITGRLTLQRREDEHFNQILDIHVELKRAVMPTEELKGDILIRVIRELVAVNSEFASEYKADSERATPNIVLWPNKHSTYFSGFGKQPWVAR
jgi:phenylacetate-CoA ligase